MNLAVLVVTIAQILDLGTFVRMIERDGISSEANPLVASLLVDHGLPLVIAVKVAALALVVAALVVLSGRLDRPGHPRLVAAVAAIAILAGLLGGLSNAATILAASI